MAIQHVKDTLGLIQTAGSTYIGNDADQTYIINPNVVGAGDTITIVDKGGANKIQLTQGVEIVKSVVVADETQLTLSNGAVINVRGADTFTFNIGGDAINGVEGVDTDFQSFAEEVLGAQIPAEGEPPVITEPNIVIQEDGSVVPAEETTEETAEETEGTAEEITIELAEIAPTPENTEVPAGTVITSIVNFDPNITYTLEGDDASLYEIDSETGEIKVVEAYTPDFETKDAYNIVVKAVDADGNEVTQDISIPVEDIEPEGENMILTTEADEIIGTAGDDTFVGVVSTVASEKTLNSDDVIDGADGIDTLNLELKSSLAAMSGGISNVENINLDNTGTVTRGFDATNISGVDKYSISGEKGVNLSNLVEAGIEVEFKGVQADTTIDFDDETSLDGTDDAMTLTFDGVGTAATEEDDLSDVKVTMENIENVTVNSVNSANFVDLSAMDVTALTATGDSDLTVTKVKNGITSVDASALEGNLTIDTTDISDAGSLKEIKSGAGDDTFTVDAADLLAIGNIDGGDGEDNLILSDSAGTTLQLTMAGVETLTLANSAELTFSTTNTSDLNTVVIGAEQGG